MTAEKRVILISGASRGIGEQCALLLANDSTHLILTATDKDNLKKVAQKCQEKGASVECLSLDLSDTSSELKKAIEHCTLNTGNIDILINNAGLWKEAPFESGDMDLWDDAIDVNLKHTIHLTKYCLQSMPSGGAIVFIGSTASRKSYAGGTNYCATKFGLLGFAGALFEDIREKGIKVCSILPGVVNTDMHKGDPSLDTEKMIQPQDVAKTVDFVINMPCNVCPTEITLLPQKNPKSYTKK